MFNTTDVDQSSGKRALGLNGKPALGAGKTIGRSFGNSGLGTLLSAARRRTSSTHTTPIDHEYIGTLLVISCFRSSSFAIEVDTHTLQRSTKWSRSTPVRNCICPIAPEILDFRHISRLNRLFSCRQRSETCVGMKDNTHSAAPTSRCPVTRSNTPQTPENPFADTMKL